HTSRDPSRAGLRRDGSRFFPRHRWGRRLLHMVLRFAGSQQVAALVRGLPRSQAGAWLLGIRAKCDERASGHESGACSRWRRVLANGVQSRAAVGATVVRNSRPRKTISIPKDPASDPLSQWLILIPVGCLLIAMVCAAALSRFGSASAITS